VDLILRALAAVRFLVATILLSLGCRIVLCMAALPLESLPLLVAIQASVTVVFLAIRMVYVRRKLHVAWSELLPYRGLGLPTVLGLAGSAATLLIDRSIGDRPIPALAVSGLLWTGLIGITLWRDDAWRRSILGRFSKAPR
jgi:hypothetical protein